jgi:hypothetical protein
MNPTQPTLDDLIERSKQVLPDALRGQVGSSYLYQAGGRGELLPAYGTRERLLAQRNYYRLDYNYMVRGAFTGIAKRIASLPFEIRGGDTGEYDVTYYQDVLRGASFNQGWGDFVKQIVLDFLRYDTGAYIEVIAEGDPLEAIDSPIMGLANLDATRCYPTGDPRYPVVFWDDHGRSHLMHYTRVIRMYDMPDNDDLHKGWGDSALSRAISIVNRQVLMGRYVEQSLDDNPPPGLMIATNINKQTLEQAINTYSQQRNVDSGGIWGKNVWLYGLDAANVAKIESVPFSNPPEKFSFRDYTELDVDALALALGVDRQELWQLSSGSLGSGAQSEILSLKARGKTIGDLITSLERVINDLLPDSMEFSFKYRDEAESATNANTAQAWANAVQTMSNFVTQAEGRDILARNIPTVQDAITDESGTIVEVSDTTTIADEQIITALSADNVQDTQTEDVATDSTALPDTPQEAKGNILGRVRNRLSRKSYQGTLQDFTGRLDALMSQALLGAFSRSQFVLQMNALLADYGERAYIDGLKQGGASGQLSANDTKRIASEYNKQSAYVPNLSTELYGGKIQDTRNRATMWGKSLQQFYNDGLLASESDNNPFPLLPIPLPPKRYKWRYGLTEHCTDCLRLNGQVHTLRAWQESGWMPRASKLKCKGYHCKCELVETNEKERGRF